VVGLGERKLLEIPVQNQQNLNVSLREDATNRLRAEDEEKLVNQPFFWAGKHLNPLMGDNSTALRYWGGKIRQARLLPQYDKEKKNADCQFERPGEGGAAEGPVDHYRHNRVLSEGGGDGRVSN